MIYPKEIAGCWSSYGNEEPVIVPISDIDRFVLFHESGRNGLQVCAIIRDELIDKYDSHFEHVIVEGKYKYHQKRITIRNKDMPKFRKEILNELSKQNIIILKYGINAGTPIAHSIEFRKKELIIGEPNNG